ncbi:hypothetical protein B9Z55_007924 [Caenorhabditis nigoni]|uniref:BTB domain-containing protein n=1 Tax=Caenorhabditis nigoni TaxID=1611254 RepID=A0A2G5VC55_9PELO|nr:hypothetical protein B9Z55_007924 [Caenorhabditis nigoni]
MSPDKEKKFVIKHVFENVKNFTDQEIVNANVEKHFAAFWRIQLFVHDDGDMRPSLVCQRFQTGDWSVTTVCGLLVNGNSVYTGNQFEFRHKIVKLESPYICKSDYPEYGIDESVTIEFHVKIDKMSGPFRNFDDDVAKESSDVVLVVGDHKFHVCKAYLSYQSTYFKSLFYGKFEESEKSIIELKDINFVDFHIFLGFIYGFVSVKGSNVEVLLKLADFFNAQIVMERCEQFLMAVTNIDFVGKFQLSLKYKLDKLKNKILSDMNKETDFASLAPENSEKYSTEIWKELYLKAVNSLK